MEKKEQESLYSTIRSFVGRWWNGSELFPDPAGRPPFSAHSLSLSLFAQAQGVLCDVFDGLWYVTALSVGPVMENSLDCARDSHFPLQLFELGHLRSLSIFSCFSDPARHPLESLEARSNRGLTGEVPAAIGALNKLQSLVLEENKLSGELPHELGELSKLRRLVLSGNQFSGSVPASLGSAMSELLILDLSRNALKGLLPPAAGGLRSLVKLDLSSNLLGGVIPAALGELRSLTLLDLRNNNFSGGGEIGSFPWASLENLSAVGLSNTFLGGEIPAAIAGLKGLRLPAVGALYLNRNNLSGRLQFSSEFYRRMGTRFAAWGNPNLCYAGGGGTTRR
ncbi:unnamed protein product [Spirodela intermedia]|uniref:Uncharacterized protein n=1 Tax=Spirodela intermedia TaxID=51605 RepID=A0A7I8J618_SPIIN|nr:unnamed protein product [Spirodela intermedia]CAA6665484.1 unnamed protein product [Spirodela intermedia]